jgi:hypothetical protein
MKCVVCKKENIAFDCEYMCKKCYKKKKKKMCIAPRIEDLDLKDVDTVAIDLETYDPNLKKHGSGAIRGEGFVCGIAIATDKQTLYSIQNTNMIYKKSLYQNLVSKIQ